MATTDQRDLAQNEQPGRKGEQGAQEDRKDRGAKNAPDNRADASETIEGRDVAPSQRPKQDSPWMGGG